MLSQRRMLGSYYRIRFFGQQFEELDNTEFIYKEPKITKLVEVKERLEVRKVLFVMIILLLFNIYIEIVFGKTSK